MQPPNPSHHKHALQSICSIRNTDYLGTQPHFRLIKNPSRRTKRYSSSAQQDSLKLEGWDDPSQLLPTKCTNMLYNLSVKLQNYEVMQKKKDGEVVLDEIKENYKSIVEKTRLFVRPNEVFSKYREQINLYKQTEHSQIIQTHKQLDLEYPRPASNQIISARPKLQITPTLRNSKQSQLSVFNRDQQLLIQKHKSLKSIREYPKTTSLVARGKANKFQKFKHILAQHEKLLKIDSKKNTKQHEKKLTLKLKPRKYDLSLVEKKERLNQLQKRSNGLEEQPKESEFQDTKLFRLR